MRRRTAPALSIVALSATAWFAAGAVLSYLAAIALVLAGRFKLDPNGMAGMYRAESAKLDSLWSDLGGVDWPPAPDWIGEIPGIGWSWYSFSASNVVETVSLRGSALVERSDYWTGASWHTGSRPDGFRRQSCNLRVKRGGWPWYCVTGHQTRTSGTDNRTSPEDAWQDHAVMRRDPFPAVAILPLWSGLAANALIYGGALWLLTGGLLRVRRRLRVRRGQCAACGYPRGESRVCTECGRPYRRGRSEVIMQHARPRVVAVAASFISSAGATGFQDAVQDDPDLWPAVTACDCERLAEALRRREADPERAARAGERVSGRLIRRAAFCEDACCVGLLLAAGADPDAPLHGPTPLEHAAFGGRAEAVALLLSHGAEASADALAAACSGGHVEIAKVLLDAGASAAVADGAGRTALHEAAGSIDESGALAELLLAAGAAVEPADSFGETPLMEAVERGSPACAAVLLRAGADPNQIRPDGSKKGCPLLTAAVERYQPALLEVLLDHGARLEGRDPAGRTALFEAASTFAVDGVGLLLARGAEPDAVSDNGMTPLAAAAAMGGPSSEEAARLLLVAGADPRRADDLRRTPLHHATRSMSHDIMARLVEAGCDVDARDSEGRTPLWSAAAAFDLVSQVEHWRRMAADHADPRIREIRTRTARLGSRGFVLIRRQYHGTLTLLTDHGADPNLADDTGTTPLTIVARQGDARAARILLRAGADPRSRDATGLTASDYASQRTDDEGRAILRMLRELR